jgi:type VI protein secretion system component VasA
MENIFDGIQRPLEAIAKTSGDCFIPRGINVPSLDVVKQWEFRPSDKFKVAPCHLATCKLDRNEPCLYMIRPEATQKDD